MRTEEELTAAVERGRERARQEMGRRTAAADSAYGPADEGHSEAFKRGAARGRAEREKREGNDLLASLTAPDSFGGLKVLGGGD